MLMYIPPLFSSETNFLSVLLLCNKLSNSSYKLYCALVAERAKCAQSKICFKVFPEERRQWSMVFKQNV